MGDSNQIQVRFQGTKAQEEQYLDNCRRTEAMFALTLLRRLNIAETDENHAVVASWMQSARNMGVGNFITSGLSAELVDPDKPVSAGAEAIVAERLRQISEEGWREDNDDQYENDELLQAAACYVSAAAVYDSIGDTAWPWSEEWWKPGDPVDKKRCLAKAGALIAAEMDRLDRLDLAAD